MSSKPKSKPSTPSTASSASKKRKHAQIEAAAPAPDAPVDLVADGEARLAQMRAKYRNKQHTLIFASRGITSRFRHLMSDMIDLTPHSKKEVKFDAKGALGEINEVADYKNCNNVIFFECRKKQDLYLWVTKAPHGPSIKFHVNNVHTMNELKFAGNSLKGSRPILNFDKNFDSEPELRVIKELLSQAFATPYMHPRSRPFIDHVLSFYYLDGRIWFRNYQIADEYVKEKTGKNKTEEVLVEMGPRFVMNPIKILSGSFGGKVLWENPDYVSPNQVRSMARAAKSERYVNRVENEKSKAEREALKTPLHDELEFVFKNLPKDDEEEDDGDAMDVDDDNEDDDGEEEDGSDIDDDDEDEEESD